jgi:hypothetical protein
MSFSTTAAVVRRVVEMGVIVSEFAHRLPDCCARDIFRRPRGDGFVLCKEHFGLPAACVQQLKRDAVELSRRAFVAANCLLEGQPVLLQISCKCDLHIGGPTFDQAFGTLGPHASAKQRARADIADRVRALKEEQASDV